MRTTPLVLIVATIAILAALFFFAKPLVSISPNTNQPAGVGNVTDPDTRPVIKVLHQYKTGAHVYVGELELPTPCHSIEAESVVLESYPEQVQVILSTKEGEGICAQVITPKKFKVAFQASKEASVNVSLNGGAVRFEVGEAPPSLNLEAMPL